MNYVLTILCQKQHEQQGMWYTSGGRPDHVIDDASVLLSCFTEVQWGLAEISTSVTQSSFTLAYGVLDQTVGHTIVLHFIARIDVWQPERETEQKAGLLKKIWSIIYP